MLSTLANLSTRFRFQHVVTQFITASSSDVNDMIVDRVAELHVDLANRKQIKQTGWQFTPVTLFLFADAAPKKHPKTLPPSDFSQCS